MNDKLKSCPFCGGEAEYHENCIDVEFGSESWIRCTRCGCSFQTGDVNDTRDKVVEKWNTRVNAEAEPSTCDDCWFNRDFGTYIPAGYCANKCAKIYNALKGGAK